MHAQIKIALPQSSEEQHLVRLVLVLDGLEPEDDRKDERKLVESIHRVMPGYLEDLIKKVNRLKGDEKITCVIADASFGWALEIFEKVGAQAGNVLAIRIRNLGLSTPHSNTY